MEGMRRFGEEQLLEQDCLDPIDLSQTHSTTDSNLLSDWLPLYSSLKPVPVKEFCSSSSDSLSSSSNSFSRFSEDICDLDKGIPDTWLGGLSQLTDEYDSRLPVSADYNLSSDDSFLQFELFPEYILPTTHESLEPSTENVNSLPGISSFRKAMFDDDLLLIPTCVSEFSENDSYIGGSNSVYPTEKKVRRTFNIDDSPFQPMNLKFIKSEQDVVMSPKGQGSSTVHPFGKVPPTQYVAAQKRKPGRPKKEISDNSSQDDSDFSNNRSKRRRKQHPWKGHHLWEFIRELLENNDNENGGGGGEELVRWENREKGVFLIVNSKEVAELWGKRKRNDKMTYEKLSRSLRWCRTSGFLAAVPNDRKYPKKLCFCFGHRAYDIHRSTMTTTTTKYSA